MGGLGATHRKNSLIGAAQLTKTSRGDPGRSAQPEWLTDAVFSSNERRAR
jgi:hypothetical protein